MILSPQGNFVHLTLYWRYNINIIHIIACKIIRNMSILRIDNSLLLRKVSCFGIGIPNIGSYSDFNNLKQVYLKYQRWNYYSWITKCIYILKIYYFYYYYFFRYDVPSCFTTRSTSVHMKIILACARDTNENKLEKQKLQKMIFSFVMSRRDVYSILRHWRTILSWVKNSRS